MPKQRRATHWNCSCGGTNVWQISPLCPACGQSRSDTRSKPVHQPPQVPLMPKVPLLRSNPAARRRSRQQSPSQKISVPTPDPLKSKRVCPRSGCGRTFDDDSALQGHIATHSRSLTCDEQTCSRSKPQNAFINADELQRHQEDLHFQRLSVVYFCPYSGCGKVHARKRALLSHLVSLHGEDRTSMKVGSLCISVRRDWSLLTKEELATIKREAERHETGNHHRQNSFAMDESNNTIYPSFVGQILNAGDLPARTFFDLYNDEDSDFQDKDCQSVFNNNDIEVDPAFAENLTSPQSAHSMCPKDSASTLDHQLTFQAPPIDDDSTESGLDPVGPQVLDQEPYVEGSQIHQNVDLDQSDDLSEDLPETEIHAVGCLKLECPVCGRRFYGKLSMDKHMVAHENALSDNLPVSRQFRQAKTRTMGITRTTVRNRRIAGANTVGPTHISDAIMTPCATKTEAQADDRSLLVPTSTLPQNSSADFPALGDVVVVSDAKPAVAERIGPDKTYASSSGPSSVKSDLSSNSSGIEITSEGYERFVKIASAALVTAYGFVARGSDTQNQGGTPDKPEKHRVYKTSKCRKRKLNKNDDDPEDGPSRRKGKSNSAQPIPNDADSLLLACPFNKYNHILFGPDSPNRAYHGCSACAFINVAHLKQHLQRVHKRPKHYCFDCGLEFTSEEIVKLHMRERTCEVQTPPPHGERIDQEMANSLDIERKNTTGMNRATYWWRLYNAFFPWAHENNFEKEPVSPYCEGVHDRRAREMLFFARPAVRDVMAHIRARYESASEVLELDDEQFYDDVLQQAIERHLYRAPESINLQIGPPRAARACFRASDPSGTSNLTLFHPGSRNIHAVCATHTPGTPSEPSVQQANPPRSPPSSTHDSAYATSPSQSNTMTPPSASMVVHAPGSSSAIALNRHSTQSHVPVDYNADYGIGRDIPHTIPHYGPSIVSEFHPVAYDPALDWSRFLPHVNESDWDLLNRTPSYTSDAGSFDPEFTQQFGEWIGPAFGGGYQI